MIFVRIHTHRWVLTGAIIHGCRVQQCTKCGDRAYDPNEEKTMTDNIKYRTNEGDE